MAINKVIHRIRFRVRQYVSNLPVLRIYVEADYVEEDYVQ